MKVGAFGLLTSMSMMPEPPAPSRWPLTGLVHRPLVTGMLGKTVLVVPSLLNLTSAGLGLLPVGEKPVLPQTIPPEAA